MSDADPLLWVLAGPNGAGKTTFYERKIRPILRAPFVSADTIAAERWPKGAEERAYEAAALAAEQRDELIAERRSFVTETVFSHSSKLELLARAKGAGYVLWLTFVGLESADLAIARVGERVRAGGHSVPKRKIRARYRRLPDLLRTAVTIADKAFFVDNSYLHRALRDVATFERGKATYVSKDLPEWVRATFPEIATADR